nr:hypothetical protein Itr_chr12CG22580 [Ipomoea trifida]
MPGSLRRCWRRGEAGSVLWRFPFPPPPSSAGIPRLKQKINPFARWRRGEETDEEWLDLPSGVGGEERLNMFGGDRGRICSATVMVCRVRDL